MPLGENIENPDEDPTTVALIYQINTKKKKKKKNNRWERKNEPYLRNESRHNYLSPMNTSFQIEPQHQFLVPFAAWGTYRSFVDQIESLPVETPATWCFSHLHVVGLHCCSNSLLHFPHWQDIYRQDAFPMLPDQFYHHHLQIRDLKVVRVIPFFQADSLSLRYIWHYSVIKVSRNMQDASSGTYIYIFIPFWRISLFLHLCKNTIRLVVYTMRAFGHLAITFDFFSSTHIACLL